ncbi:MAG: hypothetical protein F7B60_07335 [Desulfurococcales archaeon]|nr:hypothetical protein [Desulfurococcales archaeon]
MDIPGVNMNDTCLQIEALHKSLVKANKILEEAIARTPATITSYPRLVSLSELTKGSSNIIKELLETYCKTNG